MRTFVYALIFALMCMLATPSSAAPKESVLATPLTCEDVGSIRTAILMEDVGYTMRLMQCSDEDANVGECTVFYEVRKYLRFMQKALGQWDQRNCIDL